MSLLLFKRFVMSIGCLVDRMQLLIIWCAAFICIYGEDEVSSCEVAIKVWRGTTKRVSPGQSVTVKCPIEHCGKPFNVTWCKFSNTNNCEHFPQTKNVEIRQKYEKNELISYLSFKQVSIIDNGLYRCVLEHFYETVSHAINITVSDQITGVENPENGAAGLNTDDDDVSWLPYFVICISIVLLISTAITLTLVCFHGWKRTLTRNRKNQEEISTQMIPQIPNTSCPAPILQTQTSFLNDIYTSSEAETTMSRSPALVASTAATSQVKNDGTYAVINHLPLHGTAASTYTCEQNEKTNYAVINVS